MIKIHCTKKLFNDLTLSESGLLKPHNSYSTIEQTSNEYTSPLNHWHAHYFSIQRSPCLFLLHDATRFPLFIPNIKKADLRNLDYYFDDALKSTALR